MKLTMKEPVETRFPNELLEQCRNSRFGSCRLDDCGRVISEVKRTAAMTANGWPIAEHEDICQVLSFSFDPVSRSGAVDAILSLITASSCIKMRGELVDITRQQLLGSLPLSPEVHDTDHCELATEFYLDGTNELQPEDVAVLIWADWQADDCERHMVVEHDNNGSIPDHVYEHIFPRKEKKMQIISFYDSVSTDEENHVYTEIEKTQRGSAEQIIICFNRSPQGYNDVDYKCMISTVPQKGDKPYFAVPGRGIIRMLGATANTESKDLSAQCTVVRADGGGGAQQKYENDYTPWISANANGEWEYNTLMSWKQEFLGPSGSNTIKYDYILEIKVPFKTIQGGEVNVTTIVSSRKTVSGTNGPDEPIPQIIFMWGCIAGDSKITMADHSQKPMDCLKIGDLVCATDGSAAHISNIWTGSEDKPLIRLEYDGNYLLLTDNHPVKTPDGWRRADRLKVGDEMETIDGSWVKLDGVQEEMYEGSVYNVELSENDGGIARGIYANNLAVGELSIQNQCGNGGKNG